MKRQKERRPPAPELSQQQAEKMLKEYAKTIKAKRKEHGTLNDFCYEANITRASMQQYESGGDMLFTSFLRVIHGLNMTPLEFFKEVEKQATK